jgi:16S rRNA processing protein RimM
MLLRVGQIVRPHGIRGELIVVVRTDEPAARFAVGATVITERPAPGRLAAGRGDSGRGDSVHQPAERAAPATGGAPDESVHGVRWLLPPTLTVAGARSHQGRLIVTFDGVYGREVAEELRGVVLWVDSAELTPPEDPDEFHDHQLVGLSAVTPAGETVGKIARIDHAPASDLLVLRRPDGGTALVPFVKAIVPEVDLAGGRVVVDPPEGLFDL